MLSSRARGAPSPPAAPRLALCVLLAALLAPRPAGAVRPFITDDARVVGDRAAQMETWGRLDPDGLQHWLVAAVGPVAPLEVSLGAVYGVAFGNGGLGAALPLLQLKVLALEPPRGGGWPGLALAAGTLGPGGAGSLQNAGWDTFAYAAFTESFADDDVLLHQNVGLFVVGQEGRPASALWGLGAQVRVLGGLHGVGEIVSGDPYAASVSAAVQGGLRYFVSSAVQIDATVGTGLGPDSLPPWGTIGLRIASDPGLWGGPIGPGRL